MSPRLLFITGPPSFRLMICGLDLVVISRAWWALPAATRLAHIAPGGSYMSGWAPAHRLHAGAAELRAARAWLEARIAAEQVPAITA